MIEFDNDKGFEKAKELRNSTRLRKYKSSKYPEVLNVINYLYDEMVDVYDLTLDRESNVKKLKHHIEFFVQNLYKAYCNDPTRVIAYSRDRNTYTGKKSKYKMKFGLSFRYSVDKGKDGKPVIGFLEKQGYIETFSFQYDRNNPNNSYRSRMRATPKLIDLIVKQHQVTEDMVEPDTSDEETIIVKGVKPKPKIIYVTENGKRKRKKIQGRRKICKTPDTPIVREMRKNLEIINQVMDKAKITLDVSEEDLRKLNARMRNDLDPNKQLIDFSRKRLHRVFLDRRLDRGGRFYGPWYQNIPKEYRQHIMINDAPTMELDYSALHPNLLYHLAGADPPKDDLYELDGYSKDTRNFMKAMFLRMINSAAREDAKGSIREAAFLKGKIAIPEELGNLEDKYLDPLIDKFLEKHKAIKDYIFTDKDLGNQLQYIDSTIAETILVAFAKEGIPVLPLHDSFRIDIRLYDGLEKVMRLVIQTKFGKQINISDEWVPCMTKMITIIVDRIINRDMKEEEIDDLIQYVESKGLSTISKMFRKLKDDPDLLFRKQEEKPAS